MIITLPMGQSGVIQTVDGGTIVRHGVQAVAGDIYNPVKHIRGNSHLQETVRKYIQGDGLTAGSRTGDSGNQVGGQTQLQKGRSGDLV